MLKHIDDEADEVGRHTLDTLLNHVISILIAHALHDMPVQLADDQLLKFEIIHRRIERTLSDATPVHLETQSQYMTTKSVTESTTLIGIGVIKKLLNLNNAKKEQKKKNDGV